MSIEIKFEDSSQTFATEFSQTGQTFDTDMGKTTVLHDGQNGATFIPSVSADGVLSWTNDRELPNPDPVKIKGKDGYTPVKGKDYFDGKNGYTPVKGVDYFDGKEGYTPEKGKDYFDGVSVTHLWDGTVLTITSASGTSSADLKGKQGDPGKTPNKGVDYFTDADKAEMVEAVIAALPVYDGSVTSV